MDHIYMVVWAGGYEAPSYWFTRDEKKVWERAEEWRQDMKEGDSIDVLKINAETLIASRMDGPVV